MGVTTESGLAGSREVVVRGRVRWVVVGSRRVNELFVKVEAGDDSKFGMDVAGGAGSVRY